MAKLQQAKESLINKIDDLFGFNLSNRSDGVSYDFGQYRLNKLYKPLVKYFIEQYMSHLEQYSEKESEKVLGLFSDFFSLYYSNGDFGYFKNRFSTYQYRIPYSGKDTEFWRATKDCYYVKTSDVVNDMAVSLGGIFADKEVQIKMFKKTDVVLTDGGDEKYSFDVQIEDSIDEETEELTGYKITFINYEESKDTKKQKETKITEALATKEIQYSHPAVKKSIDEFLKKRGRDYFIHKRLKAFLTEELERYFFQMLKTDLQSKADILSIQTKIEEIKAKYSDDTAVIEFKIGQLMKESQGDVKLSLYETAYLRILNFVNILADLEEFKAKLWNKKKKVIKQEYCISLAKIPASYHTEVLANEAQQAEWKAMGMTAHNNGLFTQDTSLVIDTKNYSGAIREKLLELGQSEEVMGELYYSDNYQALRFMQDEYTNKIQCIYIDPPYNTGNDGFVYKDSYQSASWLSMMQDRLGEAKQLMSDDGVIFTSIDDNEITNLESLQKSIFGNENFVANLIWKKKRGKDNSAKFFSKSHEYLLCYTKNISKLSINKTELDDDTKKAYKNPDNDLRGSYRSLGLWARGTQGGSKYSYTFKNGTNVSEQLWLVNEESLKKLEEENRIIFVGKKIYRKLFIHENKGAIPETLLLNKSNAANAADEIKKVFGFQNFETVKALDYIKYILTIGSNQNDLILDFFAGSGTTGHAVMKLNKEDGGQRKFLLVELGRYFDTVTLPRIKKVMYSDNRNDGQATDNDGTHGVISYKKLNQYEDRFSEGGYLDNIEGEINQLSSTDLEKISDIKQVLFPLSQLKERIYGLDDILL